MLIDVYLEQQARKAPSGRCQRAWFDHGLVRKWISCEINALAEAEFQSIEPLNLCACMRLGGFENMVAQICPRWNPLTSWMRQIEDF